MIEAVELGEQIKIVLKKFFREANDPKSLTVGMNALVYVCQSLFDSLQATTDHSFEEYVSDFTQRIYGLNDKIESFGLDELGKIVKDD